MSEFNQNGWQDIIRRYQDYTADSSLSHWEAPVEAVPAEAIAWLPDSFADPSVTDAYTVRIKHAVRYDPASGTAARTTSRIMPEADSITLEDHPGYAARLLPVLGAVATDYARLADRDPMEPLVFGDVNFREGLISAEVAARQRREVHTDSSGLPPFVGYIGAIGCQTISYPGNHPNGYRAIDSRTCRVDVMQSGMLYRFDTMLPHCEPDYRACTPNEYRSFVRARIWREDQLYD